MGIQTNVPVVPIDEAAFSAGGVVFGDAGGVATSNSGSFFWDNTNIRLGVGTSSPTNLLTVGNAGVTGTDAGINVTRTLNDTVASDSRAVADNSVITRTLTTMGYDTFDATATFIGTANRRVWDAVFSRVTWNSSGTLASCYGLIHIPTVLAGTVTSMYGVRVEDWAGIGGTVTTSYGVYIDSLSRSGTSWAFYAAGSTQSYFGGNVGLNTLNPRRQLDILDASNPQMRISFSDNSQYTDFKTDTAGVCYIAPTSGFLVVGGTASIGNTRTLQLLGAASAGWTMNLSSAAADAKFYECLAFTNTLKFNFINDAQTVGNTWMQATRSGASVTSVSFPNGNVSLFGAGSFGSGTGVLSVINAGANPSANPTGGGILYANGGAGTWRGSGGTITAFGPAGPHCGNCGMDMWTVAALNTAWKAWCYECGHCGAKYKGGPQSVLEQLSSKQKTEILRDGMAFEEVCAAVGV